VAEERLDALTGTPGVIHEVAATVILKGKVSGAAGEDDRAGAPGSPC
jgi:hypothetical protein